MLLSHKKGFLYKSARTGIISLIPKGSKDLPELQNLRPLVLLNIDSKILTKMLAQRIKPMLHKVIGNQQTGQIYRANLRKFIDILMMLECEEKPFILITLDFFKCFNSIEHSSLFAALRYFNVGEYVISWIVMIYKDFELCVTNNGFRTKYQVQSRGVHQGFALSGQAFLFTAEILAHMILYNDNIKRVDINGTQEKLSQYAEDTSIWSKYDQNSLNAIIDVLETLYENTGLKVNYDKSVIYKVGSLRAK